MDPKNVKVHSEIPALINEFYSLENSLKKTINSLNGLHTRLHGAKASMSPDELYNEMLAAR